MARANTERIAKLSDVARAAGVSQGTVSNVFNRPELVREEVRKRVLDIAAGLGYRGPDPRGRLLRAGKVNAIGIATMEPVSYFFTDPYAQEVMAGISEAADAAGAGLSLVSAANAETLAWNIQTAVVDGFILFCIEGGDELVRLTRERQLPFVALALGGDDRTVSAIGIDDAAGARLAAEHLAGLGHRRFAVLSMELDDGRHHGRVTREDIAEALYSSTRERVIGYFEGLARFGIDVDAVPIFETLNDEATVRTAVDALFAAAEPPTALLAQSDRMAVIAMRALQERGLRIPQDVSIVGFDGTPEGAAANPPLTTVVQPMREIGRAAVAAILAPPDGARRQLLPLEFVIRGSTAPPPTGASPNASATSR
ncbi:MAG TPA: LacI family DNA-binding transcriptional regulator [Devosia sp.]|nr:LacI family DNA-binding transcriptional regulator [Devosia sp.]